MNKHDHVQTCNHNILYCSKCDTCYCDLCNKEWVSYNIYPWPGVYDTTIGTYTIRQENHGNNTAIESKPSCNHRTQT